MNNFNLTVKSKRGINQHEGTFDLNWYTCSFIFHGENNIEIVFDMLSNFSGFGQSDFSRFFRNPVILKEDELSESIQNLVEFRNMLLDNGEKIINHLNKFKI